MSKTKVTLTNLIHVVPMAPGTSNKSQPYERKNKNKDHQLFRFVNHTKSHAQLQNTCWHIKRWSFYLPKRSWCAMFSRTIIHAWSYAKLRVDAGVVSSAAVFRISRNGCGGDQLTNERNASTFITFFRPQKYIVVLKTSIWFRT